MPRRDQVTRRGEIAAIEEYVSRPVLYRVKSRARVHDRSSTSGRCPCCGSAYAKIVDEWDDLDLLIDTTDHWRALRGRQLDAGAYDDLVAQAEPVTVPLDIRCSVHTVDATFDEVTRITAATGGARSTKTQTGVYWAARQWMLRGGPQRIGWFVAPQLSITLVLRDKWCVGEGLHGDDDYNPPVIPPELVAHTPSDALHLSDREIVMVDGFHIRLVEADARRMSGRSIAWWLWTEAALTSDPKAYARARGRLVSSRGQGYLDAVPESRMPWLRSGIIEAADDEEVAAIDAAKRGEPAPKRNHRVVRLSSAHNVWLHPDEAAEFAADLQRIDPRLAAREAGGHAIGDANLLFSDVFDASRNTFETTGWDPSVILVEHEGRTVPLRDITRQAGLRWFAYEHDWIISVDVNANPHTSLMGKIACPDGANPRNPHNWVAVWFDCLQVYRDAEIAGREADDPLARDPLEAAETLAAMHGGLYAHAGVLMDGSSTWLRHNAGGLQTRRRAHKPLDAYQEAGFEVRGPTLGSKGYKNPDRADSAIVLRLLLRTNRAFINRLRCKKFIRALKDQEAEPDGITPLKMPGTIQDRLIVSFTDCARYWTTPFFDVDADERGDAKPMQSA